MAGSSRWLTGSTFLVLAAALAAAASAAALPPISLVTGQDGGWPDVRGFSRAGVPALQLAPWGNNPVAFAPYSTYQYGVRVAVGDLNGDGKAEIVTAPAKGAWTELRVFNGTSFAQTDSLLPYKNAVWWNGAFVATGDTNGDGRAEIVDGLDAGCCTTVHVLDPATNAETSGFYPYANNSEIGVRVACADLNGDGKSDLLTVTPGTSRVGAFGVLGGDPFRTYSTFGTDALGGVTIAAGDVTGDSRPELVAAANTSGGVAVKVIDTQSGATLSTLYPYGGSAVAPPEVAVGDVNGDGRADIVLLAQFSDGAQVRAIDADGKQLGSFYVLEPGIVPGASLAVGDLHGDGTAEIVLGAGANTNAPASPANGADQRVVVYGLDGKLVGGFSAYPGLFQGGVRVVLADVERNGRPDIVTAPGPGMPPEIGIFSQQWFDARDRGTRVGHFLAYESSFTGGVSVAAGYWSGAPQIVVAPGPGRPSEIRVFDGQGRRISSFLAFEPTYTGGTSVAVGDVNGDGIPEIVAGTLAAPARIRVFDVSGAPEGSLIGPFPPDGRGVQVGVADVRGDGHGLILAGETTGPDPLLEVLDPATGAVVTSGHPAPSAQNGIRVGAGDLNRDGRDEILVTTGWGGDGSVRVLGPDLRTRSWYLQVYTWNGGGLNVAAAPRVGLPLRSNAVTVRLAAQKRARVIVAHFNDAGGPSSLASGFRAAIDWGDGTAWRGVVVVRGGGSYDVRSLKRYARRGTYRVRVTLVDNQGRVSIAQSSAVVRAPR